VPSHGRSIVRVSIVHWLGALAVDAEDHHVQSARRDTVLPGPQVGEVPVKIFRQEGTGPRQHPVWGSLERAGILVATGWFASADSSEKSRLPQLSFGYVGMQRPLLCWAGFWYLA